MQYKEMKQKTPIKSKCIEPNNIIITADQIQHIEPKGRALLMQPRNYQVCKYVVHEIKFGDIAVM